MRCPSWALALVGLPVLLGALKVAPTHPLQALDLLEEGKKKEAKKWNWKEASEESKTEWAIVLKRYVLADMTVFELGRFFGESLPASSSSGTTEEDQSEALGKARTKLARLTSSLEKAVLDQNTSDITAVDMQATRKSNFLTVHEKRILAQEHKHEQEGYFAVEASGQDILEKANELMQALDAALSAKPKKTEPSWSSIVEAPPTPKPTYLMMLNSTEAAPNATQSNSSAQTGATLVEALFSKYEEASKTFHGDLASFESMQKKTITNFLAMSN